MRQLVFYILLCCLAACTPAPSGLRIGVSQCSDDAWRTQMNSEMLREARLYENVELLVRCARDDNRQQEADIQSLIDEGIDLLIVAPNQSNPITPVVEAVYDRGIPVVVIDRRIDSDKYTAYVGGDNYGVGCAAARYVAAALGGKGKVIEITGLPGSSPALERHRGFRETLEQWGGIEVAAQLAGNWMAADAEQLMDSLLASGVTASLVYAQNDEMAAGAHRALCKHGADGQVRIVGTDAIPGASGGLEAIRQGWLEATFLYPTGGDVAVQVAMNILRGEAYERENRLNTVLVNADNVEAMLMQTDRISQLDRKIERMGGKFNDYLQRFANQRMLLIVGGIALLLLVGLLALLFSFIHITSRKNALLQVQKQKLEEQKETLAEQKLTLEEQRDRLIDQKTALEQQKGQLEEQTGQLLSQTGQLIEQERLLKDATQAKLAFFTNVSHDFRTPLTLIEAPIEQLLADEGQTDGTRRLLLMMKKNVHILLRLVNQILDFRKVENGRMEMSLSTFDLSEQLSAWSEAFRLAFLRRHIHFDLEIEPCADYQLTADMEKLERVYFNLLSNAAKYTPDGGTVRVNLEATDVRFCFAVTNSGSRLTPEELDLVFDRFYQAGNYRGGTGIGLALVRSFVEMHGGSVTADSNGQGTCFRVELPRRAAVADGMPSAEASPSASVTDHPASSALAMGKELLAAGDVELTSVDEPVDPDAPSVLVIDDNADIRSLLKMALSPDYRVLTASDGEQGLRLALKFVPDVVVSDVMMPYMDGRECCRRLKSEMQTSHIPVILLTACSLEEQRIEGYDCGADSYISKPFSTPLLLARIQNLITGRQKLRQLLTDTRLIERADLSDLDKDFASRFRRLVEERMSDSDLNVEDIGRELGMSRVQLYRKLKQLTNFSPVELLRQMRLKRAASLLVSSDLSVSEIAYEVGFSSPSYFTKCYKEEFGVSPSEVVKQKR